MDSRRSKLRRLIDELLQDSDDLQKELTLHGIPESSRNLLAVRVIAAERALGALELIATRLVKEARENRERFRNSAGLEQ